jgi:hypothetical protein
MTAQSIDETQLELTGLILRADIKGDKSDPRLPITFWKDISNTRNILNWMKQVMYKSQIVVFLEVKLDIHMLPQDRE